MKNIFLIFTLFFLPRLVLADICAVSQANYTSFNKDITKFLKKISTETSNCLIEGSSKNNIKKFVQQYKKLKVKKIKLIDPIFMKYQQCLKDKLDYRLFFNYNFLNIESQLWTYFKMCKKSNVTINALKGICKHCSYLDKLPVKGFIK